MATEREVISGPDARRLTDCPACDRVVVFRYGDGEAWHTYYVLDRGRWDGNQNPGRWAFYDGPGRPFAHPCHEFNRTRRHVVFSQSGGLDI